MTTGKREMLTEGATVPNGRESPGLYLLKECLPWRHQEMTYDDS